MGGLTATDVLAVWEAGRRRSPAERALLLVTAAYPELSRGEAAALTIGERDRRILDLREASLGPVMEASTACPACASALDFQLSVAQLRAAAKPSVPSQAEHDGWNVAFRVPDTSDLIALAGAGNVAELRHQLLIRSLLEASHRSVPLPVDRVPTEVLDAISSRLSDCDPQGDVQLNLLCPECEHSWSAVFDIGSFFWTELGAVAHRLLRDVHTLASAYGWKEDEVLHLTPARRHAYLELVAG
jgi:hypothetical protein